MITKHKPTEKLISQWQEATETLARQQVPDWFGSLRQEAKARVQEAGIPTVKDEEWKYTSLASLTKHAFELPQEPQLAEVKAFESYCDKEDINIVFVNGVYSQTLSDLQATPNGITITPIKEAITDQASDIKKFLTKYNVKEESAFVALNTALNDNGLFISVDKNTVYPGLIHIIHVTSSHRKNIVSTPRSLIAVGQSSEITVLESHIAFNDQITYFTNALTDVFLKENATLHYCKAQKESLKSFHIGHTRVWQEGNSNFDGFTLTAGGKLTRNGLNIVLNGEGADAVLNALYSVYDDQHVDNHTSVDHRVPNCTSNQLYKGILNNDARAVFNGKVYVKPIAQQTNSYQLNKNLLLGENCRVDTKPQLEIFADDVKCTHGATIGQLDEDELFYLQTRSISRKSATQMLVRGFVNDLFQTIKHISIRNKVNLLMKPSFEILL